MNLTQHARQRMSQRGIPSRLVDCALRHGRIEGDRFITTFNREQPVRAPHGSRAVAQADRHV